MKIISWNVNSLAVRLEQVLALLAEEKPDILALQETKLPDDRFPVDAFRNQGWHCLWAGQKAYNGVALITKAPLACIRKGAPWGLDDEQKRFLLARTDGGLLIASVYAPNGQAVGSEKYRYKLAWYRALADGLAALHEDAPLVLAGDWNVAPEDRDVHDPKRWRGKIMCSEAERKAWRAVLEAGGLVDAMRIVAPDEPLFTWWDYRLQAFRRGWGLRIDHLLVRGLVPQRVHVRQDYRALKRPSDHAPVVMEFADGRKP